MRMGVRRNIQNYIASNLLNAYIKELQRKTGTNMNAYIVSY